MEVITMQVSPRIAIAVALLGGVAALLSILSSQWLLAVVAVATVAVGVLAGRRSATSTGTVSSATPRPVVRERRTPDRSQ